MASASDNHQCDLCRKRHITKDANVWCFECNEFLCSDCGEIHQVQNFAKDHKPIQITEYLKLKPNITAAKYECDQHDTRFDRYCVVHDTPICERCVTEIHNTCTNFKPMTEIAENIKESFLFTDLKERASDIQIIVRHIIKEVSSQQFKVTEETERAISVVEAAREDIDRHLDRLQDDIIKKIKKNEKVQNNQINKSITAFQELLGRADETLESLSHASCHASNLHTYFGIKIWNDEIRQVERGLSSLQKNIQYLERFKVDVNLKLKGIQSEIKEFASLNIKHCKPSFNVLAKERQGQRLVANLAEKADITLSNERLFILPASKKKHAINGCCIMDSGNMIFTDYYNRRLITVDKTEKSYKKINLHFHPYDVVEVDHHTVGVTSDWEEKLVMIDILKGKVTRTVFEGKMCWGLCYIDKKFIVSVQNKTIKVIDLDGKVLSTIEVVNDALYCCVKNDRLYYTAHDADHDSVYCSDMTGSVKWKYACNKGDYPLKITVDNKDNVLVVCWSANIIKAISKTGKESKVLLTEKDGINKPWAITYNKKHNILLVANQCDRQCFVYDIK